MKKILSVGFVLIVFTALLSFLLDYNPSNYPIQKNTSSQPEDKTYKIISFIESKINAEGYNGCTCRRIDDNLVQCDLQFPTGTTTLDVSYNTRGVAETFAQAAPLAATIYYTGYSGNQKVCEFKYDMYARTVKRTL